MEVTATIEPEDIWNFARAVTMPPLIRRMVTTLAVILAVLVIFLHVIGLGWQIGSVIVLAFIGFAIADALRFKPRVMKQMQSTPGLVGLTTTAISASGVRRRNPIGESTHPWASYTDVRGDGHNL